MATKNKWLVDREKTLDDFAQRVEKGEFNKMPYCVWRDLYKKYSYQMITIQKAYDAKGSGHCGYTIKITHMGKDVCTYCCETNDGALGSYIQKYIDKDEKENMTYNKAIKTAIDNCDINDLINNYSINHASSITTGDVYSNTAVWSSPNVGTVNLDDNYIREMIDEVLTEKENKNKNEETNKMNTNDLFHFEFGPVSSNIFRMSPYGLAVRTEKNGWIAYNAKTGDLMDVDVLNFDISKMIYKMPVALSAIAPGDILMHGGKPVFVRDIGTGTLAGPTVNVIDYATASVMDILPVKSPFGFNFFTKVCPLIDMSGMTANPDNPFGNMLPFLMLNGENNDFDPTLLFLAGGMGNMNFSNNPMMLYFLMNRQDKGDILPFLMIMNGGLTGMGVSTPANSTAASATTSTPASV